MLNDSPWQGLADHAWSKIKVIIVEHNVGRGHAMASLVYYCLRKRPIDRDVPRFPCIIYGLVHVGSVGRTPHIVLQEPEEGVAEYVIELVIRTPRCYHILQIETLPWQGRLNPSSLRLLGNTTVSLSHGTGYPGEVHVIGQSAKSSDHSATAAASLKVTLRGKVILHWPSIADKD
jgi:hypothetical protein